MKNVDMSVEKNVLTIKIDLKKRFGPSESGKTLIIASTQGSQKVGQDDVVIGLNCYVKNPDFKPSK